MTRQNPGLIARQAAAWLVVLASVVSACSGGGQGGGSGGTTGSGGMATGGDKDGGTYDGPASGTPYTCAGFIATADGGRLPAADAGATQTCVVGQTYCFIALPRPNETAPATAACLTSTDGVNPTACMHDPTCACFCDFSRGGFHCDLECGCTELDGFATVSCESI